jgi:hypothetical protein
MYPSGQGPLSWCAAIAVALALVACGGDDDSEPSLDLPISLKQAVIDENDEFVSGMKVCVRGRSDIPCATTGNDGNFELKLPKGEELVLSYTKDEFLTKLRPMQPLEESPLFGVWYCQRKKWFTDAALVFSGTVDFSLGIISAQSSDVAGLKFELSPNDSGSGAIYGEDVTFKFTEILTETSTLGVAAFLNVPPGMHEVHFVHPDKTCATESWAGQDPSWIKAESVPDSLTHVTMPCK